MSRSLLGKKASIALAAILVLSTVAALIPSTMGASPPPIMWLTQLPHEDYEEYGYSSLDVCPDGSIIVAGWYDNITSIEYNAGVLLKLDTNGIMEWITSFGGPTMNFYQVRALSGGSYIVSEMLPMMRIRGRGTSHSWSSTQRVPSPGT